MDGVIGNAKLVTVVAGCACLAACGGGGGGAGPISAPPPAGPASVLAQFTSCDDLRGAIVEDGRRKIAIQAARLRADGFGYARTPDFAGAPPPSPSTPFPEDSDGPDDFTDTNVQVEGVDEADFVETDGAHLHLLHGSDLVVLDSFPPEATALRATLAIEGSPLGMFVADRRALVISQVYDPGDLGGDDACHFIGPPLPTPAGGIAIDALVPCAAPFTKITLIDLTGESPRVAREVYLEGYYTAARRHGGRARVVVQRGWGLPAGVPEPWTSIWSPTPPENEAEFARRVDAWEEAALAALDASALDEWLPEQRERVDGSLVEIPASCADAYVPPPGLGGDGATTIFALDMTTDAGPVREALVMGGAVQVYASLDTLLLGQPDWSWYDAGEATDRTAVHVFSLPAESLETGYLGSGFVPGAPLSQLSFDVRGGVVRVATTLTSRTAASPDAPPPTASRITTARIEGQSLVVVGSTPDLAPGERIFSARFLGDLAYLVTFRQIDPLFVVDLADPAAPRVLGEVELPGFSEYIHPLGSGHLLTVGRDADTDGRTRGVALRIFDVSDPAAPSLSHVQLLPGEGWSPAESDHLAFTFDTRLGLLALPYSRYDGPYRSSLVLVGVDATTGFSLRGEIDHDGIGPGACPGPELPEPCFSSAEMRRGLFIEDAVYSISTAAVVVNALADLTTAVAEVELPAPPSVGPPPEPLPVRE